MTTRQGTMRTYDPCTRGGSLVFDDGTVAEVPPGAVDDLVRHLRPGQRVRVELDGGQVRAVTILTL